MAINVLSGILKGDGDVKKSIQSIDVTLQKIYKSEVDRTKREISNKKAEDQAKKTKEKDGNILEDILKELKNNKKGPDKKESLIDKLKAGLGFIMKGIGSIFGKGGLIGKLLLGALGGKFFEGMLGPLFKGLFKVGGPIFGVVTAALIGWKIGEWLNKNVIEAHVKPAVAQATNAVGEMIDKASGGGEYLGITTYNIETLAREKFDRTQDNNWFGTKAATGAEKEYNDKDLADLKTLAPLIKERKRLNDELYNALQGKDQEKINKLKKEKEDKETELNKLILTFSPGLLDQLRAQKKQRGGPITVPGTGSGDKVPMLLPPGSFVMNRNAAAMFQSGGLVPTLLEPGEKVFGPGDVSPLHHMFNSMVPRFAKGGEVKPTQTGTGDVATRSSGSTHPYLTKLNDENIKKAYAGPGLCVTGTLNTMENSGVPNPAATGADVGNNPRGAIVQLIKSFGWQSIGGTSTPLNSPYGKVNTGVFGRSEYAKAVDEGKVPSGALIFQTKHAEWDGTSDRSRGYDMAIAQKQGRALWNGGPLGQWVYGNTNKVIALTPGGKAGSGGAPGAGGNDISGDVASAPTNFMDKLLGSISGLGPVGEAISGVFNSFKSAMGEYGDTLLNAMFGMGPTVAKATSETTTGGISGSSEPLTGEMAQKAKMMYDYIKSKGLSDIHAKGLVANMIRESSLNPTHDAPAGAGLFQWTDNGGRRQNMKASVPDFKTNWKGQIDYALSEPGEPGPQFKNTNFKSAEDAAWFWLDKWERSADRPGDQVKNKANIASMKFQQGGIVNMSGTQPASASRFDRAQKEFAEMIATAAGSPIIVMNSGGGGNSPGVTPVSSGGSQPSPPSLPTLPSSLVAASYWNQLSLQDVC